MNPIPESIRPRLKAVHEVPESRKEPDMDGILHSYPMPRRYRIQSMEISREEYLELTPGATLTANGVIAMVLSASRVECGIKDTPTYEAEFEFYDEIKHLQ